MSVCEFIKRNGVKLLVYRLISIIIAMRTWNEILEFGNDFYQSRLVAITDVTSTKASIATQSAIRPQLISSGNIIVICVIHCIIVCHVKSTI